MTRLICQHQMQSSISLVTQAQRVRSFQSPNPPDDKISREIIIPGEIGRFSQKLFLHFVATRGDH
jgi:hypothetical protein